MLQQLFPYLKAVFEAAEKLMFVVMISLTFSSKTFYKIYFLWTD